MAQYTTRKTFITRLGKLGRGPQQILHITAEPKANKPALLALDAVDPTTAVITTYFFWMDSAGVLRRHTAIPTTEVSDGSIVGEDGT